MFEPTGSVYLDAPKQQHAPTPLVSRRRVLAARLLGFVGVTAMAMAGVLAGIHYLIADPAPTVAAIDGALDSTIARAEMQEELSAAISNRMVDADVSDAAATYGIDVAAQASLVANDILDDPTFRAALDEFVVEVHDLILIDPSGPVADTTAVTNAAVSVMKTRTPQLADLITPGTQVLVLDASSLPDLSQPMRFVYRALVVALIAMIGIPLAAAIHPQRHRVLAWVGRLWLTAGASVAVATVLLPYLGGRLSGWATVEVATRAAFNRFLAPASATALVGLALMTLASVLKRREQTKTSREGAGVALGLGLTPGPTPARSKLETAGRGLVDAGRPLTST